MTRKQFFTENVDLIMRLTHIGSLSVGSKTTDSNATPFSEQSIGVVILDNCPSVDEETMALIQKSPITISKIDFDAGEVFLIPEERIPISTVMR
nr:hypothetical protein [uncultured Arsenicibacter sp.]